jgi:hypothetical protein
MKDLETHHLQTTLQSEKSAYKLSAAKINNRKFKTSSYDSELEVNLRIQNLAEFLL